ncbi:hypothetical protein [Rufibacter roseus]|uniref:PAP2 superfamily protein n=1 Tax=Rufibacter roseus TaxID=1567108 RepID=A0ABW2DIN8_9BACT|nr:hypothetical protein [Rufibacter roseus]
MNLRLASALSVVFHPLLLPSYLFLLILYYLPPEAVSLPLEARWYVLLMVFLTTFLLPTLGTLLMRQAKVVKSMTMEEREDRRWPFLLAAACYTVTTFLFFKQPYLDRIFFVVMGLITATVYLALVINQFWKISAHSIGLGGGLGILLLLHGWLPEPVLVYPIVACLVVSGAVLSARLALGAHTENQVYIGYFLGFMIGISLWGFAF